MKRPGLFPLLVASILLALAGSVGGVAIAQDTDPVAEEAQAPPKPQTHEEALAKAVQDGDLPRLEQLLTRSPHPSSATSLALELAARPNTAMCGMGLTPPRVPWTRERFLPVFRRLLRTVTDTTNGTTESGESLLLAAASLGDLESVRHLIERGVSAGCQTPIDTVNVGFPKPTEIGGRFPLLEAVRSDIGGDNTDPKPLVAYLLQNGADPNATEARGLTALLIASGTGDADLVRVLLAGGADPNLRTKDGESALNWARKQKHKKVVALLAPLTTLTLTEASAMNDTDAVKRLLDGGADINGTDAQTGETALMAAASVDAANAATVLLERGAPVKATDSEGENALHVAVKAGNVAMVTLLLEHKADPNAVPVDKSPDAQVSGDDWRESLFPLARAIEYGHIPVVEALLKHGARFDTPARTNAVAQAYARAAGRTAENSGNGDIPPMSRANRIRLLDILVAAGLRLQKSPVAVYAARSAPPALLETLLDRGASPDARFVGKTDGDESTALMATISRVQTARDTQHEMAELEESGEDYARDERDGKACFRLLLRRGANIHAATRQGVTAFMRAVQSGCFDLAEELLRRGANINAADKDGRTALHRAVSNKHYFDERALRYLLKHGANRSLRDKHGDNTVAIARKHGLKNAVALLAKK
ncbi:MAG: ankyrin repeat domain-containing protein [Fibrella sp.]|nr:ankyrin repeat domain-containing protein [Armatimonadota bacterium]